MTWRAWRARLPSVTEADAALALLAAVARRAAHDLTHSGLDICSVTHDGGPHPVTECALDYLDWLRSMAERPISHIAGRMLDHAA